MLKCLDLTTECVKCSKWCKYKLPKDRVQSTVEVVGRQKEEKSRDKENVVREQIPGEIEKKSFVSKLWVKSDTQKGKFKLCIIFRGSYSKVLGRILFSVYGRKMGRVILCKSLI